MQCYKKCPTKFCEVVHSEYLCQYRFAIIDLRITERREQLAVISLVSGVKLGSLIGWLHPV